MGQQQAGMEMGKMAREEEQHLQARTQEHSPGFQQQQTGDEKQKKGGPEGPMSPMSGASLTQAAFDASFQQNLSVMKLFPGHPATAGHPPPPSTSASPSGSLLRP